MEKTDNMCVLIMAGGIGTRFWPKSTEEKPKQFISLLEERTMIQITVDRIKKILPIEKIFISTGKRYINLVKEQLPDLPDNNIIVEPIGRNTAPCILLSTLYIKEIYGDCNIAVLPSDHLIQNVEVFLETLKIANNFVTQTHKSIVTIGITPDRPETGYGYIKFNKEDKNTVVKVDRFVEKPNFEKAKEYLDSKEYLWNAGRFIFNAEYMLNELESNYKNTNKLFKNLPSIKAENYHEKLNEIYPKSDSISIDYAVMERSKNIYVIPSDFGWDDIGTWKSLERYIEKDQKNNICKGHIEMSNTTDCTIYAQDKKIILVDVEDLFVIDSDDAIVVCKKDSINKVKDFRTEK